MSAPILTVFTDQVDKLSADWAAYRAKLNELEQLMKHTREAGGANNAPASNR